MHGLRIHSTSNAGASSSPASCVKNRTASTPSTHTKYFQCLKYPQKLQNDIISHLASQNFHLATTMACSHADISNGLCLAFQAHNNCCGFAAGGCGAPANIFSQAGWPSQREQDLASYSHLLEFRITSNPTRPPSCDCFAWCRAATPKHEQGSSSATSRVHLLSGRGDF